MTSDDVRGLLRNQPFTPFRLYVADGRTLMVPHPDFALIARGDLVIANEQPDGSPGNINMIPYEHIVRIEMLPNRRKKAA